MLPRVLYRSIVITWASLFVQLPVQAQYFGGNPTSLKWKRIDTDTVRVIFPAGLAKQANRITDIIHYLGRTTTTSLGSQIRPIPIVLQPLPVVSNAYVGLAPWRSEFFLTPPQNSLWLGGLPWTDLLALHEYRHVQQFMNFRKGLSRFAWIVAGEQGQALANSMAIPDWFYEGDAVWQETALSSQGRGRLPVFFNGYRSLWQAQRKYSYMKLRNGSLKDYVPNHYQLGYLLVARARERHGTDVWARVTDQAARFKPLVFPFQGAFRVTTGQSFKTFTREALAPREQPSNIPALPEGQWITRQPRRNVVEEHLPYVIGKDSVLLLHSSYRDIPAWQLWQHGRLQRLAVRDIALDDWYSHANGWIAYAAYRPDPRWGWRQYSEIALLDLHTGARRFLTNRTRYFSPALSHDARHIAAVEVATDGSSALHILDARTGEIVEKMPNPEGYFLAHPTYSQDDTEVYVPVRGTQGHMALAAFRRGSAAPRILVPFSSVPIAFPRTVGTSILFTASWQGHDRLMSVDVRTGAITEVASGYTGIYGAAIDTIRNILYLPTVTASGQRILTRNVGDGKQLPDWRDQTMPLIVPIDGQARSHTLADSIPSVARASTRHAAFNRLLNIHSWRPFYDQPDWTFSFYSENVLNTFRTEIYHQYNENEGYNKTGFEASYASLYPWITGSASFTNGRNVTFPAAGATPARTYRWDEWNANAGLRLPLNLTRGRNYRYLTLVTTYNIQQVRYEQTSSVKQQDRDFAFVQSALSWSSQSQQAVQQIYPRYAQVLSLRHRVGIGQTAANQFLASAALYLPGLTRTQSLVLNAAYQARDTLRQYAFSNSFPLSRGYPVIDYPHMWKWGANYHFTLAYPDFGILQLVYLLRVRANIFYDQSWVRSLRQQRTWALRSVGTEIYFDTKWWNQLPVSFGVRYARLLDTQPYPQKPARDHFEFVMPINLIPDGAFRTRRLHGR
ncbi:MAG: hypothetical protein FJX89_08325 [Bacteroidetes bacterium]|nr:hypothetical protein [Bacteroidota bacterium]